MSKKEADKEKNKYESINLTKIDKWENYFIGPPYQCAPLKDQSFVGCNLSKIGINDTNNNPDSEKTASLLLYENGGYDLHKLMSYTNISLYQLLKGLRNVLAGLRLLNTNMIFHLDIKSDNIVSGNLSDMNNFNSFKFIDFGLASKTIYYLNTVKTSDIKRVPVTNSQTPNNNKLERARNQTVIEVQTPTVLMIKPFYQFFLNYMFKDGITDEEYEILSKKFLETFLGLPHSSSLKMIRTYYFESGFFEEDPESFHEKNYLKLKQIMDKLFYRCFHKNISLEKRKRAHCVLFQRLDIYSFALLLFSISCDISTLDPITDKNDDIIYDPVQNLVYEFIHSNNLLNPDPAELKFNFEGVLKKYDELLEAVEKIVETNPSLYNPRL